MSLKRINTFFLFALLTIGFSAGAQNAAPVKSYVTQSQDGIVFDAKFSFRKIEFSGLLVANQVDNGVQIDMLSKTGVTLMSCTFTPDSAIWNRFIPGVKENKRYKQSAEKSFRIATLSGLIKPEKVRVRKNGDFVCKGKMKVLYRLTGDGSKVQSAKEMGWFKLIRRKVQYEYQNNDKTPLNIGLSHSLLNFDMDLKRLN